MQNFTSGKIFSVSVNASGRGLISGHADQKPYAGFAFDEGVIPIPLDEEIGILYATTINRRGVGIIGGEMKIRPFAAFVSFGGGVTPINLSLNSEDVGTIYAAAINDSGSAIIGGEKNLNAYLLVASPSGEATEINRSHFQNQGGTIKSIDMSSLASSIDPKIYGPGNSFASPLFTLSSVVLKAHLESAIRTTRPSDRTLSYVASTEEKHYRSPLTPPKKALWFSPFGSHTTLKQEGDFPSQRDRLMGGILGVDFSFNEDSLLGGGAAFASQKISLGEGLGEAHVNQELVTCYGEWKGSHFTFDGALSGGVYQIRNQRNTLGFISSHSKVHGALCSPHFGIKKPISLGALSLSPFLSFDWINNWQGKIQEVGQSGLNLRIAPEYLSILRSEVGVIFLQEKRMNRFVLSLKEGVSYVSQSPFHVREVTATYVGSSLDFRTELFNPHQSNLGSFQLNLSLMPLQKNAPEFMLDYRGEWGKKAHSNALSFEIKQRF